MSCVLRGPMTLYSLSTHILPLLFPLLSPSPSPSPSPSLSSSRSLPRSFSIHGFSDSTLQQSSRAAEQQSSRARAGALGCTSRFTDRPIPVYKEQASPSLHLFILLQTPQLSLFLLYFNLPFHLSLPLMLCVCVCVRGAREQLVTDDWDCGGGGEKRERGERGEREERRGEREEI